MLLAVHLQPHRARYVLIKNVTHAIDCTCTFHPYFQAGRRVLLLERDLTQPDRIVGELLQPGGYLMLKKLGLEACVDGIDAQQVYGYCMFKGGKQAKVAYPVEGYSEDVAGRSFHNGRFVQRLRQAASAQASVTVRQGTARRLINGVCLWRGVSCALDNNDAQETWPSQKQNMNKNGRMGMWFVVFHIALPMVWIVLPMAT